MSMKLKMKKRYFNLLQISVMIGFRSFSKLLLKRRLKKLLNRLKSENQRFDEILYMDDTPFVCSQWIEKKMTENNIVIHKIENKIL